MALDPHGPASPEADDPADRVAREAARRLLEGRAPDEEAAIDDAQRSLGLRDAWPSRLRVHRHMEGMEQQAIGLDAWRAARDARLAALEELLTLLEEHAIGDPVLVVGRAARGHLTGTAAIRLRIYTERPIGEIAAALEDAGIEDVGFETDDTGHGRFDALRFVDEAGEVLLVRLPPTTWGRRHRNLYHDEPVPVLDLAGLRRRLAETSGAGDPGPAGDPRDQSAWENAADSSSANEG